MWRTLLESVIQGKGSRAVTVHPAPHPGFEVSRPSPELPSHVDMGGLHAGRQRIPGLQGKGAGGFVRHQAAAVADGVSRPLRGHFCETSGGGLRSCVRWEQCSTSWNMQRHLSLFECKKNAQAKSPRRRIGDERSFVLDLAVGDDALLNACEGMSETGIKA